jgi:DNA-binding CsgD family transcriptional regulator
MPVVPASPSVPLSIPDAVSIQSVADVLGLEVGLVDRVIKDLCAGGALQKAGHDTGLNSRMIRRLATMIGWQPHWRKRKSARLRQWNISEEEALRLNAEGFSNQAIGVRAGVTGEAIRQFLKALGREARAVNTEEARTARRERALKAAELVRTRKRERAAHHLEKFNALVRTIQPAYSEGLTLAEIAERLNLPYHLLVNTITKARRLFGTESFPARQAHPWLDHPERLRSVMEPLRAMDLAGATIQEMAARIGKSDTMTAYLMRCCRKQFGADWFPDQRRADRRSTVGPLMPVIPRPEFAAQRERYARRMNRRNGTIEATEPT